MFSLSCGLPFHYRAGRTTGTVGTLACTPFVTMRIRVIRHMKFLLRNGRTATRLVLACSEKILPTFGWVCNLSSALAAGGTILSGKKQMSHKGTPGGSLSATR